MDEILAQINKHFDEIDQRFNEIDQKLDATIKWFIGLDLFVLGGILAIIVKLFFFGP
jgi:hypothetical protein